MGEYRDDWFSFDVKSRRRVMDLIIEPSFAKSVCFQVHEMENDLFKLFWNFGMVGREIDSLFFEYVKLNKIDLKTLTIKVSIEFLFGKDFAAFMRQRAPEIFIVDLDADDMNLINAVVNANWQDVKYYGGLDGHSYRIKIYGEEPREFECWCVIPKESRELIPLVDRLIEIAKLEPLSCYTVHDVY